MTIPLAEKGQTPATYTVRLYFSETGNQDAGQRVFDVKLQGKTVLENFDIIKEAPGPGRAVVKQFKGVRAAGTLTLELLTKAKKPPLNVRPLINAVEIVRE